MEVAVLLSLVLVVMDVVSHADGRAAGKALTIHHHSQRARDVDPMLVYCWATVVDGGPTISQHWVNVSHLLTV